MPDLFVLFLLILSSIIFFVYKPLRSSSGLLLGASWMLCHAFNYQNLWYENNLKPLELSAKSQWVEGKVSSLQSLADLGQLKGNITPLRFNLDVNQINSQQLNNPIKIRLSWKNAKLVMQQGQLVKLKAKFKPAHGLANIGGFSYKTWLRSKRLVATGYVIDNENNKILIAASSKRQQLFNRYKNLLPKHNLSPLLLALGFGSRSELNPQLWQVMQATGTGHLIAISGLHIGLVATGSYFIIMLLLRLLPISLCNNLAFYQTWNIRYFVIAMSLMVAIIYGYLAGFSLPTIRALIMLSLYWLARLINLHLSIKRWLLFTLFILTIITPFSLFTASFWLSVYAVIIIFLTLWRFKYALKQGNFVWRFIKGLLVIQLSLTIMLVPVSALFFQQISSVALLANVIAVPWMSFISIPLCLVSVLVMPFSEAASQFLIVCCIDSLQVLWQYLHYLSQQSWAVVKLSSTHVRLLVLFGVASAFLLFFQPTIISSGLVYFRRVCVKKCFVVLSMSMVLIALLYGKTANIKAQTKVQVKPINWQLVVFDVGQGLSVLIRQGNKAILYDTGASYPSGFNMVSAVILPYLQHSGIKALDKVIISHSDNDHSGGLKEIQQSIVINELIYNEQATTSTACVQENTFTWQNLDFSVLWPKDIVSQENDDSCVLLISDGKRSVLLTGDISKQVEAKLLQQYPELKVDIVIVPHHGSKTSSSDLFLTQLKPTIAAVSAGYLNRWHMPVKEVVQRYHQHNIELVNTASSGQIIFNISETNITTQSYYSDLWPFWFAH